MATLTYDQTLKFFLDITKNANDEITYIKNLLDIYPNILDYMLANQTPDLSQVKYVKYKRYNQLKEKVLINKDVIVLAKKLEYAFDLAILRKLIEYFEDKFSTDYNDELENIIVVSIKSQPYDTLCRLKGIGFISADKILMAAYANSENIWNYNLKTSVQRCTSFMMYYLLYCMNGDTYVELSEIKHTMINKYYLDACIVNFEEALKDVRLKVLDKTKLMLKSTFYEEQNIAYFVNQCVNENGKHKWKIDCEQYKELDNFTITDTQLKTLYSVCDNQITLLNGYAGTGKSSSVKALINMLEDNEKDYVIISPTAKAAKTISNYTGRFASTIHYLLCSAVPDFDFHLDENEYINVSNPVIYDNWKYTNEAYEKLPFDMIIIDEVSMLSNQLFNILIRYIDPKRTKILLIGDSYQLPSVQQGNLYQDLLDMKELPKVFLDKIFRYTENGLVKVATAIRLGKRYLNINEFDKYQEIGDTYKFYECPNTNDMLNEMLNKYVELIRDVGIENVAILTAKNVGASGTYLINSVVQKIINPINLYDETITIKIDKNEITFKENDIVMNVKNNYNAIVADPNVEDVEKTLIPNGQIGVIKSVDSFNQTMIIEMDGVKYKFELADIRNLRLGYCFTIHKSQGSEFQKVMYLTTKADSFMTSSNLLYVAVTRAKEECYHFGSCEVVNNNVNYRENLKRKTTLNILYERCSINVA